MVAAVSVCIITKNEEKKISTCLKCVQWADEVIVVDDFSEDRTPEICRSFKNVKFYQHAFHGFGMQKSYAVGLASHDWVFNIDADEEVTPELRDEIISVINEHTTNSGFYVRRNNLLFGKYIKDSYPGVLRLFRKGQGDFNKAYVHERVILRGNTGQLEGYLTHRSSASESYRNHYRVGVKRYGVLVARDYAIRGVRITPMNALWKIIIVPILVFIREFIVKRKVLQGFRGFYISLCIGLTYYEAFKRLIAIQSPCANRRSIV